MLRYIFMIIPILIISFLLGGFYFFKLKISQIDVENQINSFQGIAVLTGGKGRIKEGIELLEKYPLSKLLISGVEQNVSKKDLTNNKKNFDRIYLDKESKSTLQNAKEIANWVENLDLKKIMIITSYYHMPRSIILLKHFSADTVFIVKPVSKKNNDNIGEYYYIKLNSFLFEEYLKYLFTFLILIFS